jgi:hypothetical protein
MSLNPTFAGGWAGEDCANTGEVLFFITASTQMTAPKIATAMSTGDDFFLTVGRASVMIEGTCGLPQCGQLGALGEMSLPQSGHFIRGIT